MTLSTTYLRTKFKLYILKSSNSSTFTKFWISFRKLYFFKFGWTATPSIMSSFSVAWSISFKMTQIFDLNIFVSANDNELFISVNLCFQGQYILKLQF